MKFVFDYLLFFFTGGTDILSWKTYGTESDIYITDLTLQLTNINTKQPVYYLSVKAENGAGQQSPPVTSTPIIVVDEDKPGKLIGLVCNV